SDSSASESTTLENGSRVIVIDSNGFGIAADDEADFIILAADGTEVSRGRSPAINNNGSIGDLDVTALVGGGFVMAFRTFINNNSGDDNDVVMQIFDENGVAVGPPFDVMEGLTFGGNFQDRNFDPDVVALSDGGFMVFFERTAPNPDVLLARRYDADGNPVGNLLSFESQVNAFGVPQATLLDNGLVAVSYTNNGEISLELIATEELDIVLTDADETITGTSGDDMIEGAGGADSLDGRDGIDTLSFVNAEEGVALSLETNSGSAGDANGDTYANFENVIGSDFDDTITGDFGINVILSGDGDDTVITRNGGDTLDGGDDIDTLELRSSGGVVDLELGTLQFDDSLDAGVILNFENVIGSDSLDTIIGDSGDNTIEGNGGADSIDGRAGDDTLTGDDGDDTINGGDGDDNIIGDDGEDSIE
ncbi:MAG: hypothetical protein ABJ015_22815, partial [Rhodopirellula bahusiensis]